MKKIITLILVFSTTILFSQVPNYVPTNGLVGWWPFTGNANDLSGNTNNGIVNGAILTTDRFENLNSAYNFDGNQQNIVIQNSNSLNPTSITINIWALPLQNNITLIEKSNPINATEAGFAITHNDFWQTQRGLKTMFGNGSCNNTSSPNVWGNYNQVDNNIWSMITVSIDINGNVKQYINSVLNHTETITPLISCNISSSTIRIGGQHWNSDPEWFNGKIDDIGIWNRALTQQEITNLFNASLSTEDFAINEINIYPNPTTSFLNYKSSIQVEKIVIYNMLGQLVQEEKVNALEGAINIEKLEQGAYLVKVNDIDKGYTIIKN
jgi:hypothetical protein